MDWDLIDNLIIPVLFTIYLDQIYSRWVKTRVSEDEFFFRVKVWLMQRGVKDV